MQLQVILQSMHSNAVKCEFLQFSCPLTAINFSDFPNDAFLYCITRKRITWTFMMVGKLN